MIICSGTSERQVQAISAGIREFLKKAEINLWVVEGRPMVNGFYLIIMMS